MFTQDIQDRLLKIINHNGGYVVYGSRIKREIGQTLPGTGGWPTVTIVAEATEAEALNELKILGYDQQLKYPYHYKVIMD